MKDWLSVSLSKRPEADLITTVNPIIFYEYNEGLKINHKTITIINHFIKP